MKYLFAFGWISVLVVLACSQRSGSASTVWLLDNLEKIEGIRPTILGAPFLVDAPEGKAIQFDGGDDALVFDRNPLAGFGTFTVEVVFRPDPGGLPEQRFVHMQAVDDHRLLVETRLTPDGKWFLDTFLKSGESECTLYAEDFLHPVGEWFHAALVYEKGVMRHYVEGVEELTGEVEFQPMEGGQTSVGSRLNRVYWYKGAVKSLAVTPAALSPAEFVLR
jgi:hypothetical protein